MPGGLAACLVRPRLSPLLLASPPGRRYVILKGSTLTYFKSERDVQFPPRGRIDLGAGAAVELEGLKRRRHWTWKIVDKQARHLPGAPASCRERAVHTSCCLDACSLGLSSLPQGVSLIRLSTEVQSEYNSWIEALERAGCAVKVGDKPRWCVTVAAVRGVRRGGCLPATASVETCGGAGTEFPGRLHAPPCMRRPHPHQYSRPAAHGRELQPGVAAEPPAPGRQPHRQPAVRQRRGDLPRPRALQLAAPGARRGRPGGGQRRHTAPAGLAPAPAAAAAAPAPGLHI